MDSLDLLRRFARHPDGHWVCLEPATLETPDGPVAIRPGRTFAYGERLGEVDVAEFLEQLGAQFGS